MYLLLISDASLQRLFLHVPNVYLYLEPIPKTERIIAHYPFHSHVTSAHKKNKNKLTITRIPDSLLDGIIAVLPAEKPNNTIGLPIAPFRKVMDGIVCVLRTGCQWKMLPREYGSGSTCHRRFQEWVNLDIFKKMWIKLLKIYDGKKGIKWAWQSIDSISIKSPLGGR